MKLFRKGEKEKRIEELERELDRVQRVLQSIQTKYNLLKIENIKLREYIYELKKSDIVSIRVRDLRMKYNLSQEQFAKSLHLTKRTVSAWEQKVYYPSFESIKLMADRYRVPLEYFYK